MVLFPAKKKTAIFFLSKVSTQALRPTQPPAQWVPVDLSSGGRWGLKLRGREADPSSTSRVDIKNEWYYTATLPYAFTAFMGTTLPLPPIVILTNSNKQSPSSSNVNNSSASQVSPACYGRSITVFITASHSSPSWARSIQSTPTLILFLEEPF